MNGRPHLHKLYIVTELYDIRIIYGDTKRLVKCHWWQSRVSEERIAKAVTEVVKRHDEGSVRAFNLEKARSLQYQRLNEIARPINDLIERDVYGSYTSTTQRWGTEVLEETRNTSPS